MHLHTLMKWVMRSENNSFTLKTRIWKTGGEVRHVILFQDLCIISSNIHICVLGIPESTTYICRNRQIQVKIRKAQRVKKSCCSPSFCLETGSHVTPQRAKNEAYCCWGGKLIGVCAYVSFCVCLAKVRISLCAHEIHSGQIEHMRVKDLHHRHPVPFLQLLSCCVGGRKLTGLKLLTSAETTAHTQTSTHIKTKTF